MPKAEKRLKRKIQFYRVRDKDKKPVQVDFACIFGQFAQFPNGAEPKLQDYSSDSFMLAKRMSSDTDVVRFVLKKIRKDALPGLANWANGEERPIDVQENEGVTESTHVVAFPGGIIGVESNRYGPHPTTIIPYLTHDGWGPKMRACLHGADKLFVLLQEGSLKKVVSRDRIKSIRLVINSSEIQSIDPTNRDLGEGLRSLAKVGQPETVELVLKAARDEYLTAGGGFLRRLFGSEKEPVLRKASVVAKLPNDEAVHTVDLLTDKITVEKHVKSKTPRSKEISQTDIYRAIEEGYNEMKETLLAAHDVHGEFI